MAHKNTKIEKKKQYNPFVTCTIKRADVGPIKCYLRAVKPNSKNAFGVKKIAGERYNQNGYASVLTYLERYDPETVYYYEVVANDGSYRKCSTKEDALKAFGMLIEFEKRQTEIR